MAPRTITGRSDGRPVGALRLRAHGHTTADTAPCLYRMSSIIDASRGSENWQVPLRYSFGPVPCRRPLHTSSNLSETSSPSHALLSGAHGFEKCHHSTCHKRTPTGQSLCPSCHTAPGRLRRHEVLDNPCSVPSHESTRADLSRPANEHRKTGSLERGVTLQTQYDALCIPEGGGTLNDPHS
jgi:hypothetical protein